MTKITGFRAENFKRVQLVEMTLDPASHSIVIAGKNAQGKSSVLEAIFASLGGAAGVSAKATPKPIRDGETRAEAQVTLDNGLVVTRKWTSSGSTLEVKSTDGMRYPSADKVLAGLRGALSFDPLAFAEAGDKDQLEQLLGLVDLPFVPSELEAARKDAYDNRTVVNREVKRLRSLIESLPSVPTGTPDEEVSVSGLAQRRRAAQEAQDARAALLAEHERAGIEVARLEAELAKAVERVKQIRADGKEHAEQNAELLAVDVAELDAQFERVDETNRHVRVKFARAEHLERLAEEEASSAELTQTLADLDTQKSEGLAAAAFPLPGLGFDENGVTYNGVPFKQASSAERMRVSTAIAMATNPELRVILIKDASLLDSDALAALDALAAEKDYQIWLEVVGDDAEGATVVIEDGLVKS